MCVCVSVHACAFALFIENTTVFLLPSYETLRKATYILLRVLGLASYLFLFVCVFLSLCIEEKNENTAGNLLWCRNALFNIPQEQFP